MEKQEIKGKISVMKSRLEFLELLNSLKSEELGPSFHPFTSAQLSYFCNPKNPKRFKIYTIPKRNGGVREISAPVQVLRSMLHYVNIILSSLYNPNFCAIGFTSGRSVVDNARIHVRQNYVFNTDLSDFFPSIEQARVWKRLQVQPYNLSREIASVIAGLCSIERQNPDGSVDYILPQGSPASPVLSNMICERLDYKLLKLSKKFGLNYSRYADDITFSSMHNEYQENGNFLISFQRIIEEERFIINTKKTRLQKRGAHQEVTGLNVTSHVNVTRKYVNWIRTILHIWEKYGYQEAYSNFYPKYKTESVHKNNGEPDLVKVLSGKLFYMKMIKGEHDSTYSKLKERFSILVEAQGANIPTSSSLKYMLSYTVLSFEKKYSTLLDYNTENGRSSFGFVITNQWQNVMLAKGVDHDKFAMHLQKIHSRAKGQKIQGRYYISLCCGQNSLVNKINTFWLITNKKPKFIFGDIKVNTELILEKFKASGLDSALALLDVIDPSPINAKRSANGNDKNHNPLAMVSVLYKFSQDDIIKWFTHKPDTYSIDVKKLIDITNNALKERLFNDFQSGIINKGTWINIQNFVLNDQGLRRPLNAHNEPIHSAWGDENVRKWCEEHPDEHPYYAIINGRPFSSSIIEFKHAIEFRTDNEEMTFRMRIKSLVDSFANKFALVIDYQDRFIEMEPVQLFVDVRLIFSAITKIFNWINENKSKSNIVQIDVNDNNEFVELIISHVGSHLSMYGKKREGLDGDFEDLRLLLLAVADFRIEADHSDGNSYSIICLSKGYQARNYNLSKEGTEPHMKTPCTWTELTNKLGGVKYYIKMYKNI